MQRITYHGIALNTGPVQDLRRALLALCTAPGTHQVVTVNPEFFVLARHQPQLRVLTARASLCLVDGIGLAWALQRTAQTQQYPGADAVTDLCAYAQTQQLRIGVLLPRQGLSTPADVRRALGQLYPQLQCEAWIETDDVIASIQNAKPNILFVTFGQPRQDEWAAKNLAQLSGTSVVMGVGGAIDFLTGARTRAPRWVRRIHLEWMWRLATQPKRFPRIIRATFGFWLTLLTT